MKVRNPNDHELLQLEQALIESGHDKKTAKELARGAMVAICDNYVTDCPGYAGKVISVVWSGDPTISDVFTVKKCEGKEILEQVERNN